MASKAIPEGFHTITPYLVVPNVAKVIDFVKQAFGAVEIDRVAQPDGRIMHAEVRIGDSIVMLGEPMGEQPAMPAMLYLYVEDTDAAYRRAIAAGGISMMEPADQFYGDRSAGVRDASGNLWWIATRKEELSREELEKRVAALKTGSR